MQEGGEQEMHPSADEFCNARWLDESAPWFLIWQYGLCQTV